MKLSVGLLLCWIGIHRYKIINISFGFGEGGSVRTIQCKVCGIMKIRKGQIFYSRLTSLSTVLR